jgi:FkbM family methyltransferase
MATEYPLMQSFVLANLSESYAQLQQDLIARFLFPGKGHYFVEFGATNGKDLSNSLLLEKRFGWIGLLAEPGRSWHADLRRNRSGVIDTRAVARKSGESRLFLEAKQGEYSTFADFSSLGSHSHVRANGRSYPVTTVSLNDLLWENAVPTEIQLISIDTEGSEFEILSSFDFSKHSVALLFIEHNYSETESKIDDLLELNGYKRFLKEVSEFDGWYLHNSFTHLLK